MAAAFVQSTKGGVTGATSVATSAFSTQPTAGNLIVVAVGIGAHSFTAITSVTDNAGNTYTADINVGSSPGLKVFRAFNIATTASLVVTGNASVSDDLAIVAQEFSGIITTNPSDASSSNTGTSTSADSTATATLAQAAELVVGAVATGNVSFSYTLGSGYTNLDSVTGGVSSSIQVGMESKVVNATTAVNATFSISSSDNWKCTVTTYKAATNNNYTSTLTDSVTSSEIKKDAITRSLLESAIVTVETFIKGKGYSKSFTETAVVTLETISRGTTKVLTETKTVVESFTKGVSRLFTDSSTLVETITTSTSDKSNIPLGNILPNTPVANIQDNTPIGTINVR